MCCRNKGNLNKSFTVAAACSLFNLHIEGTNTVTVNTGQTLISGYLSGAYGITLNGTAIHVKQDDQILVKTVTLTSAAILTGVEVISDAELYFGC